MVNRGVVFMKRVHDKSKKNIDKKIINLDDNQFEESEKQEWNLNPFNHITNSLSKWDSMILMPLHTNNEWWRWLQKKLLTVKVVHPFDNCFTIHTYINFATIVSFLVIKIWAF